MSGSSRGAARPIDRALLGELVTLSAARLAGRRVSLGRDGSRLRATITAVRITPSDRTFTTQIEAGLDTWTRMNDAALGVLDGADPVRAGLDVFGAAVSGMERFLDSGPVDPVGGVIRVAAGAEVELDVPEHDRWTARSLALAVDDLRVRVGDGTPRAGVAAARLRVVLAPFDLERSLRGVDLGAASFAIDGDTALLRRRVGPVTVGVEASVAVGAHDVEVRADRLVVAGRRIALPERLVRRWRVPRTGLLGPFTIDAVEVADGHVVVSASAGALSEPVSAAQLRSIVGSLRSGPPDVRVDRVGGR